jgi:hypothetical protein
MTDQQRLIAALREAGSIVAKYLQPGAPTAEATLSRLIAVLDNEELGRALERLEKGHGFRVVK